MTQEEFKTILKNKNGAPFLFLGSGFSRHYLNTPQWDGILQMFAPYRLAQYYSKLNTKSLIKVASEIAKDVTDEFWNLDEMMSSRKLFKIALQMLALFLNLKFQTILKSNLYGIFPKNMKKKYISWKIKYRWYHYNKLG